MSAYIQLIFFCKKQHIGYLSAVYLFIYLSKRKSENKAWNRILPPILSTCMWLGCLRPSHESKRISFNMQNYLLNQNHKYLCFQRHICNSNCVFMKLFTHDIWLFWVLNKNWWTTLQCAHYLWLLYGQHPLKTFERNSPTYKLLRNWTLLKTGDNLCFRHLTTLYCLVRKEKL